MKRLTPNPRPKSRRAHPEPHNSAGRVATANNAALTSDSTLHRERKGRRRSAMYRYKSAAPSHVELGKGDVVEEIGRGLGVIVKSARQMAPECCDIFRLVLNCSGLC